MIYDYKLLMRDSGKADRLKSIAALQNCFYNNYGLTL